MENIPILKDIVILMVVSVPIVIVLTRLGLPTIIGFLLTGVIIGPYGLGLVTSLDEVETLSQIGIVLLLFTIGLEFSVTKMLKIRREAIIGGGLQVVLTVCIAFGVGVFFGFSYPVALLLGFVIALSSTAIVLKLLMDKGEVDTPHGHLSVGVLLFQDICVVLMVMVLQTMGESAGGSALDIVKGLGVSFIAFAVIVVVVGFLIPRIFDHVVKLRNREVFILTIMLVCLGTAWMTSSFGLSLALGAFIAGLAISESEYSNQIVAEVIPFRDTFASLFFISIGMFLDVRYFLDNVVMVLLLVLAIMVLKALVIMLVGAVLKYPLRLSIVVGLTLAQIGEFSFILIKMGEDYKLLGHDLYQTLLAATILSMAATPFIFQQSSKIAMKAGRYLDRDEVDEGFAKESPSNHVVIIGYGVNGQNLARVLKETAIQHVVLDVNITKVRSARDAGHSAFYGDASHPELLKKMSVEKAKMLVVAISDPIHTRRIVKSARELNPALSILVRTRYVKEVEDLYKLGADQVIPEEFETSVEIFARVLRDYRTPGNIIQNQIDLIRQEGYAMLRNPSLSSDRVDSLVNILEASLMDTYYVGGACSIAGQSIGEIDLRKKTGTAIIAVIRKGIARTNPGADFTIELGDIMVLLGSHAELNGAFELLKEVCPLE